MWRKVHIVIHVVSAQHQKVRLERADADPGLQDPLPDLVGLGKAVARGHSRVGETFGEGAAVCGTERRPVRPAAGDRGDGRVGGIRNIRQAGAGVELLRPPFLDEASPERRFEARPEELRRNVARRASRRGFEEALGNQATKGVRSFRREVKHAVFTGEKRAGNQRVHRFFRCAFSP